MNRNKLKLSDSFVDVQVRMAEGNPGAASVIGKIMHDSDGPFTLMHLDDMNIRGSQIWVGYKDHCNEDIDEFILCANSRSAAMVETINNEGGSVHTAVVGGASYRHK